MQCPACGATNPDDARFCAECATPTNLRAKGTVPYGTMSANPAQPMRPTTQRYQQPTPGVTYPLPVAPPEPAAVTTSSAAPMTSPSAGPGPSSRARTSPSVAPARGANPSASGVHNVSVAGSPPPGYASHLQGDPPPALQAQRSAQPPPSVQIELWLENGFVTFDGNVVELFHPRGYECRRQHVAVISDVRFTSGRGVEFIDLRTVYGGMNMLIPFLPHQRAQADRLANAIERACADRRAAAG